jgi:hypothetical protein
LELPFPVPLPLALPLPVPLPLALPLPVPFVDPFPLVPFFWEVSPDALPSIAGVFPPQAATDMLTATPATRHVNQGDNLMFNPPEC